MSFKSGANGIESKGKTKGKNLGDDGPKVILSGPKASTSKLNKDMKAMGRNLAKVANQKRG